MRKYYKGPGWLHVALAQRAKVLRAETGLSLAEAKSYAVMVVIVVVAELYIAGARMGNLSKYGSTRARNNGWRRVSRISRWAKEKFWRRITTGSLRVIRRVGVCARDKVNDRLSWRAMQSREWKSCRHRVDRMIFFSHWRSNLSISVCASC